MKTASPISPDFWSTSRREFAAQMGANTLSILIAGLVATNLFAKNHWAIVLLIILLLLGLAFLCIWLYPVRKGKRNDE